MWSYFAYNSISKSAWADIASAKCQIARPEFISIDLTQSI